MDNLARAAFMARQEGLSYGQYMAKHGTNPYAKKKPGKQGYICLECCTEIPKDSKRRKFCSDECSAKYHHRRDKNKK